MVTTVTKQKIDYSELTTGYEFPKSTFRLDQTMVATYRKAAGESSPLYQNTNQVPPMAVMALAMAALSQTISLPEGAIHVSQELEFLHIISTSDTITSIARVAKKLKSSKFHLLGIELHLHNQDGVEVLSGQTELILPFLGGQ